MYTLHHNPHSQHARRVVALLEEAGLEYRLRHVALEKGEHLSPEFLAINPNHQVPVLVDGDVKLFESNAILRYLCVKHDLEAWYPRDLGRRATVEQWLDWNQCRMSSAVVDIVLNKVFLREKGDPTAIARGEKRMAELSPILDQALVRRDFLAGAKPTIADLSVASNVTQLEIAGAAPAGSNVTSWYLRVCEIRGFRASLPSA